MALEERTYSPYTTDIESFGTLQLSPPPVGWCYPFPVAPLVTAAVRRRIRSD